MSTDKQKVSVSSSIQTIPARISEPQPAVSPASHMINDSHIDRVADCKPLHQLNLNNVIFAQDIKTVKLPDSEHESIAELMKRVVGIDITLCKHCKIGRLEKIQILPNALQVPTAWDTS